MDQGLSALGRYAVKIDHVAIAVREFIERQTNDGDSIEQLERATVIERSAES